MITSIPPPMHRMPQERIHGAQQYCCLGQSGALGHLIAQPGEEAVGPASRSFVACMREAELLEWEAAELCAAAARKDAEAASKRLAALDSLNVALSSTPAHQLRELIHVWKDVWQVGPRPSVASGLASTSTMPACTTPVPSIVPAPIIVTTAPNILGMIMSIPDMGLGDSLGNLSDVNWAGIGETIAQSHITNSPAATSIIMVPTVPMDMDDAVGQSASATTTSMEDEGDADAADVSCLSTPGGDVTADPSLDDDANLLDQILGFCTTPPQDITGTTTTDAGTASTDNAVVLAPVVSLPGDATLTVDTSVLSGGIADQLVQALVSSGDVVVSPLPMAVVPAAGTTQVSARCTAPMSVSEMKHTGKYAGFLQPKGPAPHLEADYLLISPAGKNRHYACSVEGCGMRANSRNTILKHLHTLHWNTHFQCVVGKKMKGDMLDAMGKHFKTCKYHQQNVKMPCKQLFMQHQLELDNHNIELACVPESNASTSCLHSQFPLKDVNPVPTCHSLPNHHFHYHSVLQAKSARVSSRLPHPRTELWRAPLAPPQTSCPVSPQNAPRHADLL